MHALPDSKSPCFLSPALDLKTKSSVVVVVVNFGMVCWFVFFYLFVLF